MCFSYCCYIITRGSKTTTLKKKKGAPFDCFLIPDLLYGIYRIVSIYIADLAALLEPFSSVRSIDSYLERFVLLRNNYRS